MDDVIQPAFEDREQLLAGVADGAGGERVVAAELAFEHAVEPLELLLLAEADAVFGLLAAARRRACRAASASRSIGHFGLKQRSPLRKSFICSRRHILQTGSVLRAMRNVAGQESGVSWTAVRASCQWSSRQLSGGHPANPRVATGDAITTVWSGAFAAVRATDH